MVENLRKNIGIRLAQFKFRKKLYPETTFNNAYTHARSILIIVPENIEHRSQANSLLTTLYNRFRGNKMTIIAPISTHVLPTSMTQCSIIPLSQQQLNFFFLPKTQSIEKLFAEKFDILIDLNFSIIPLAAYICRGITAKLKIGFVKDDADIFYNFQLQTTNTKTPKLQYEFLHRTLTMF